MNDLRQVPENDNYQNEKDLMSKMFTYFMLLPYAFYIMRHSLSRISPFFGSHMYEKITLIIFILACMYVMLYYIIRKIFKKVDIPIFIYSLNPKFVFNPVIQIFALTTFIILFITREGIPTQFTAGMNRYNLAEGKLQSVKKYLVSLLRGSLFFW